MYTILNGHALEVMKTLPDASVHCVVTSPPYFGLRDYGATGQIGLEKTPAEYVASLVAVFEEVRRVLRHDGTLWLNLGDSYNGSGGAGGDYGAGGLKEGQPKYAGRNLKTLKPKDLLGIPWRVAFALQDAGWYLRSDIIWAKANTMPESVKDRPTRAHEFIFLLTKEAKYFYDHEAIKEPLAASTLERYQYGWNGANDDSSGGMRTGSAWGKAKAGASMGEAFGHRRREILPPIGGVKHAENGENSTYIGNRPAAMDLRNARDVWRFPTVAYKGAHFAVFPPELPKRCILAGTSRHGCCAGCGTPYRRVLEVTGERTRHDSEPQTIGSGRGASGDRSKHSPPVAYEFQGWAPTCSCDNKGLSDVTLNRRVLFARHRSFPCALRSARHSWDSTQCQLLGIQAAPRLPRLCRNRRMGPELCREPRLCCGTVRCAVGKRGSA